MAGQESSWIPDQVRDDEGGRTHRPRAGETAREVAQETIFLHLCESHMPSPVPVAGQRGGWTVPRLAPSRPKRAGNDWRGRPGIESRTFATADHHDRPFSVASSWSGDPRPVASNLDATLPDLKYPSVVESGHEMRQPRAGRSFVSPGSHWLAGLSLWSHRCHEKPVPTFSHDAVAAHVEPALALARRMPQAALRERERDTT
jgi:hypothetical protein